ncbi:MFS transporter [Clostridium intestinale]|uniref:Predicted arabinose efflux permease, MFS family n=1 Tax=Clostridium intestinale DSM 6191 TaxID=1121320 RepID=A0A1M5W9C7_9CLOT|nr:MFS transporter [Clostridium intestinale]SHH84038.1 Predicted arabinose efflux permease, MFS family [Clostridium intestinale DSM 6191]
MEAINNDNTKNTNVLTKLLILIMAITCGLTVANLYYIQPLLGDIAKSFNVHEVSVGSAAMLTQIGYAVGMIFILPLGDIKERKNLITIMLLFSVISLFTMAFSQNIYMLIISSFAVGFTSIIPQLIIPLAAQLSNPNERGKIIGTVMSGLLIGILVSRTISGLIGSHFGWRVVYIVAAIMMIILTLVLRKVIPITNPISEVRYFDLLKSLPKLIKNEPILREASLNGALMFAAFSAFWTALTFLLESPHYNMGSQAAGLLGLVGIVGALAAPLVGKLADKKGSRYVIGICIIIVSLSYILFLILGFKMIGLIIGVILLDLGVQSSNISNQARVHSMNEEKRNRINTVYMVSFFLGGSLGSFLGSSAYSNLGWVGVCIFGISTQIIALIIHKITK